MKHFQKLFICYLFFNSLFILSQENRVLIRGVIKNDTLAIENVHVINRSSNKGSLSNHMGVFRISVKKNDTLVFSDIQFLIEELIVTDQILTAKQLIINLKIKRNELDEVVLYEPNNIAKALHLPNAGKKPLNKLERNLNYYSQESVPMVFLDALLLGPILNNIPFVKQRKGGIDDIYNIISGNRKKDRNLKKLIDNDKQWEIDEENIQKIRIHFQDEFFIKTIKIPKEKINVFIKFSLNYELLKLFKSERNLEVMEIFLAKGKEFNQIK